MSTMTTAQLQCLAERGNRSALAELARRATERNTAVAL